MHQIDVTIGDLKPLISKYNTSLRIRTTIVSGFGDPVLSDILSEKDYVPIWLSINYMTRYLTPIYIGTNLQSKKKSVITTYYDEVGLRIGSLGNDRIGSITNTKKRPALCKLTNSVAYKYSVKGSVNSSEKRRRLFA